MNRLFAFLFFVFSSTSCTHQKMGQLIFEEYTDKQESKIHELSVSYPYFKCKKEESCDSDNINLLIHQKLAPFLQSFSEEELKKKENYLRDHYAPEDERKFTLSIQHQTTIEKNYLSIVFTIDLYELGAHGNLIYQTIVYDTAKNSERSLAHFIAKDKTKINSLLTQLLNESDECFDRAVVIDDEFDNFSFSQDQMHFHFSPYELGAYVCGPITLSVPLSVLKAQKIWAQ